MKWLAVAPLTLLGCEGEPPENGQPPIDAGTDSTSHPSSPEHWGKDSDSTGARVLDPPPVFGAVVIAKRPPPPITGGTLAVTSDGIAIASDPDRDLVHFVDVATATKLGEVPLNEGDQPGRVVVDGAKRAHVVLRGGGAVATIDLATRSISARRAVCPAPRGIAVAGDVLHVACAGGELVSLPAAGGVPTRTLHLNAELQDVLADADALYVTTFRTAYLYTVTSEGTLAVVADPPAGAGVAYRTINTRYGIAMLHQLARDGALATTSGGYAGTKPCSAAVRTAITIYAGGKRAQTVSIHGAVVAVDLAEGSPNWLTVVAPGNRYNGLGQVFSIDPRELTDGDCSSDDGLDMDGEMIAAAALGEEAFIVQSREPAFLEIFAKSGQKRVVLSTVSRADTGHAIFHANSAAHIACASCHPDGGDDGRVWSFLGLGARRTQNLRGGVLDTAPFHWDGKMTNLGTLVADVWENRMSGPALDSAFVSALGGFLQSIPHIPRSPVDITAAARGKELFERDTIGCSGCHSGPLFTNHKTVDVGTGLALQVPSLRGVVFRAPYLHTGCAPTLGARFSPSCGGGDNHGKTSDLTAAQIDDLVTYLKSL